MSKAKPLALIGEQTDEKIINALSERSISPLILPAYERLPVPLRTHADMIICKIGNALFCPRDYFEAHRDIFERAAEYGYKTIPSDTAIGAEYPRDIPFNQAVIGRYILGKKNAAAQDILNYADTHGIEYISINQGYAKCSTLILSDTAAISADPAVYSALFALGIDTLKIENAAEAIVLDGYDYGFIGGASAVHGDAVYFFGDLSTHPNGEQIREFCQLHKMRSVSLTNGKLTDFGGAFILDDLN